MLTPVKRNVRAVRTAVNRMRAHRLSSGEALTVLPLVIAGRAYRRSARWLNRNPALDAANRARIGEVVGRLARLETSYEGPFYVIVMPGTLHYLIPALMLVPTDMPVVLLRNGAADWEMRQLRRRFPAMQQCDLLTLPGSSLEHGHVLTLLLLANKGNFGVFDHDLYVFDASLFRELAPGPDAFVTAVFGNKSPTGVVYPETYFLFFATMLVQDLMQRHDIDARSYRTLPRHVRPALGDLPSTLQRPLKGYHDFFDTLHVLLLIAMTEGLGARFHPSATEESVMHVGGTSAGHALTKDLVATYTAWRFVELVDDAEVRARYATRSRSFRSAEHVRTHIPLTPENYARVMKVDALVDRLAPIMQRRSAAVP